MFADSEAREKAQAEHMSAFIEAIQNSVQQGQSATMEKMATSVEALGSSWAVCLGRSIRVSNRYQRTSRLTSSLCTNSASDE
jgi:hypothetical protein